MPNLTASAMSRDKPFLLLAAALVAGSAFGVGAADRAAPAAPPGPEQKMKMDEPMATGMMKQGMRKGDVKRAADRKAKAMQPMMEQEEKAMPPAKAQP